MTPTPALVRLAALPALLLAVSPCAAQVDTTAGRDSATQAREVSPGGALRRSFAVPGWGQLYVGRPGRAVVAAGVVAGLATGIVLANGRYVRLRHAYLYVSREDLDPSVPDSTNEYVEYFDEWLDSGASTATSIRSRRDGARRLRDIAVLGTALGYVLQALDAYVAAHLLDFDVGEDLSVRAVPGPEGLSATLILRL